VTSTGAARAGLPANPQSKATPSSNRKSQMIGRNQRVSGHRQVIAAESRRDGEPPVGEYRLPGQLNLKLGGVIFDLEFDFQLDLIGNVRNEPQVVPLDHDIVACRKLVSDGM
jgi:hypothetical protein